MNGIPLVKQILSWNQTCPTDWAVKPTPGVALIRLICKPQACSCICYLGILPWNLMLENITKIMHAIIYMILWWFSDFSHWKIKRSCLSFKFHEIPCISRNFYKIHSYFVVFCFHLIHCFFYPYPSGLLHCHKVNQMIAPRASKVTKKKFYHMHL